MTRLVIKKQHTRWVSALAWAPDGQRLVSACWRERAQVWDVATGTTLVTHPQDGLRQVVWFPDGRRIATAGVDRTIDLWGAATGATVLAYHGHSQGVWAMAL